MPTTLAELTSVPLRASLMVMTGGRYSGGVIFKMLKKQMSDAANSLIGTLCRYANGKASKSGFKSAFEWDARYFFKNHPN